MIDWPNLLRQYTPLVWRTVYRLVRHDADAADCFQETFVSAMSVAQRQQVTNWAGLLQRLATARALDCLRKRRRERLDPLTIESHPPASPDADPLQRAQADELAERLRAALADLPQQQAEVFCLRHLNGLCYEEIGDELAVSVNAVGVLLHRARGQLRKLLESNDVVGPKPR